MPDPVTTTGQDRTPGRHRLWLVAVGVLLLAVGVAWARQDAPAPTSSASEPSRTPVTAPTPSPSPSMDTTEPPALARWEPGAPVRVRIPALDVVAPVIPVRAPGRRLVPPNDPGKLGWWADGARPGAERGSALIAGHTVHDGDSAMDDLEHLSRGDVVVVRTRHDTLRYVVQRVRIYHKGTVARDAERLFDQDSRGRLVLVTCEDWNGERFLSNVVVTALPSPRDGG